MRLKAWRIKMDANGVERLTRLSVALEDILEYEEYVEDHVGGTFKNQSDKCYIRTEVNEYIILCNFDWLDKLVTNKILMQVDPLEIPISLN